MNIPSKTISEAVEQLSKFPGIGRKSALRMVIHLLKQDEMNVSKLTKAIGSLKTDVKFCKTCQNIADEELCSICKSPSRESTLICVVKEFQDIISIENTGSFNGLYHVLGGLISPIDGIGPEDINLHSLLIRCKEGVDEVVLALGATMEGDTTEYYIAKKLGELGVKSSALSRGISVGGDLEYADEITLARSIRNRTQLNS